MQLSDECNSLMTIKDAARFLSISVSTLYGWVWQRRIPFVKVGRALRFERSDLEKFVRTNKYEVRTESLNGTNKPRFAYNTRAAGKG
jgi:excisionase family DNA binding protein